MQLLDFILIVIAILGVWAEVEIALAIRKGRATLAELTENVNNTLNEVNPVIAKVDGLLDEVQPAAKQIDPLMISAISAVDSLSKDLDSLDVILGDLSRTTTGIANASDTVASSVNNTVNAASGFVSNVLGKTSGSGKVSKRRLAAKKQTPALEASPEPEELASSDDGYYSYAPESKNE